MGGSVTLPGCIVPRNGGEVGFRHEQGKAGCFCSPFHRGTRANRRADNDKVRTANCVEFFFLLFLFCVLVFLFWCLVLGFCFGLWIVGFGFGYWFLC